jgi:predicted nucleic acid-binding protein
VLLVVDSSVLIDHLRGDPRAVGRLRDAVEAGDELWSVVVVRTEILAGARPSEEAVIADLFVRLRWLDVTTELADAAGHLAAAYLRSHPGVDTADYLIAAGTKSLDANLLTLNVRHFPMFEDLAPAYR